MCCYEHWGVCIFFFSKLVFLFSLDIYPGVALLDHMVVLFLAFGGPPYCFPQKLHQFAFPPAFIVCGLLMISGFDGGDAAGGFDFYFSDD